MFACGAQHSKRLILNVSQKMSIPVSPYIWGVWGKTEKRFPPTHGGKMSTPDHIVHYYSFIFQCFFHDFYFIFSQITFSPHVARNRTPPGHRGVRCSIQFSGSNQRFFDLIVKNRDFSFLKQHDSIEKSPNWTKKNNFFENVGILLTFVNFCIMWKAREAKI